MYSEQKQALAAELSFKHPAVLAVSGSAGSGKTALLAALLPVLKSRGLKVGVIREADDLRLPAETDRLHEAGAEGVAVFTAGRYLLTEQFRLNEQDLLALFERHGYDLVLLEGFGDSGWAKIEVVRSSVMAGDWPNRRAATLPAAGEGLPVSLAVRGCEPSFNACCTSPRSSHCSQCTASSWLVRSGTSKDGAEAAGMITLLFLCRATKRCETFNGLC